MADEYSRDLSKIRYERAVELYDEAKKLLEDELYKSANNRAYYAAEKAIKAALALRGKDSKTHSGVLHLFNVEYINNPCDYFDKYDYKMFQRMEYIRTKSDYDDFYLASKVDSIKQVTEAKLLIDKVAVLLRDLNIIR